MKFVTFGYRYKREAPVGANVVLDLRCLSEDPAQHEAIHALSGQDAAVVQYLDSLPDVERFYEGAKALSEHFASTAPESVIGVACHSGRHRSVYMAERLAREIPGASVEHLDIHRVPSEDFAPDFV